MKTRIFQLTLFFIIAISSFKAQNYSIAFTYPGNGAIVSNVSSASTAAINVTFNATGSPAQYHKSWKFLLRTESGSYQTYDSYPLETVYRTAGNYTWHLDLIELFLDGQETTRATASVSFSVKYKIFAENNFGGGSINLDGSTVSGGSFVTK